MNAARSLVHAAPSLARRLRMRTCVHLFVAGFAACALLALGAASASAQEIEARYQLARTQFYQVQQDKTSPKEELAAKWQAVATTFQRIHRDSPDNTRAADALFSAALALRQAWDVTQRQEDATAALAAFAQFSADYPIHRLADDSLMHQAALLEARADPGAAGELYRRVASRKPPGPQAASARARLNALLRQDKPAEPVAPSTSGEDAVAASASHPAGAAPSTVSSANKTGSPRLKRVQVLSAVQFTRVILTTDRLVKPKVEQTVGQGSGAAGQLRLDFKRLAPEQGFAIPRFAEDGVLRKISVTPDKQSTHLAFDVAALDRYELKTFELPMETKLVVDLYPQRAAAAARDGERSSASTASAPASSTRPAASVKATPKLMPKGPTKVPREDAAATAAAMEADADRVSLKASLGLKIKTVMIDPGHGGHDPGAMAFGLQEKDLALAIAQRLRAMIQKRHPDVRVGMTREEDRFIALGRRPKLAKAFGADLFVSIHLNASQVERLHGVETYFLNLTSDASALQVAARENATSEKKVSDLNVILLDLLRDTNILESSKLAQALHTELVDNLKESHAVRDLGVKQAPFMVLIGAEMPSVLVEAGFVTNREESDRLKDTSYLDRIAGGIYAGLDRYISGEDIVQARSNARPQPRLVSQNSPQPEPAEASRVAARISPAVR